MNFQRLNTMLGLFSGLILHDHLLSDEPQSLNDNVSIDSDSTHSITIGSRDNGSEHSITSQGSSAEVIPSGSEIISDDPGIRLCRICQTYVPDLKLLPCHCECKGTVGFIHFSCWKNYIAFNYKSYCEICKKPYTVEKNYKILLANFFDRHCLGSLLKNTSLALPLAMLFRTYVHQMIRLMRTSDNSLGHVIATPFVILTLSKLLWDFTKYFLMDIRDSRTILRQWWILGSLPEFTWNTS